MIRVYTKNMKAPGATKQRRFKRDLRETGADVVLLQECNESKKNHAILTKLEKRYPHQTYRHFNEHSGIAVLSRWPVLETAFTRGMVAARLDTPEGKVWVASVHVAPVNKGETRHHRMVAGICEAVSQFKGKRIVGGDFNNWMAGRQSLDLIMQAAGTRLIGGRLVTYVGEGPKLSIDHITANGAGTNEVRPRFGSDHKGVLAEVSFMRVPPS